MATEKETVILDLQVDQGSAISELEKTKKSIIQLKQEQKQLTDAYKKGNVTLEEYASESVRLEAILKKQQSTYNNVQKSVTGVKTQLDKLIDSNKKISEEFQNAATSINVAGVSVGDLTTKLASFANPATAAAGLVSALGAAYVSSAGGARDLDSATAKLSTTYTVFSNELAKLVGADGKGGGLLSFLADAINFSIGGATSVLQGKLASAAKNTLKELELLDLDAKRFAKDQLALAEEQRRLRDDDTKSFDERLAAAKNVETFITARENELVQVQRKRLDQVTLLLALDSNNLELQKELKLIEFEIADIQEDSEGKRTEALNGIIGLEKIELDLLKKKRDEIEQTQLEQDRIDFKKQEELRAKRQAESEKGIGSRTSAQNESAQKIADRNIEIVAKSEEQIREEYLKSAQFKQQLDEETAALALDQLGRAAAAFGTQTQLGKVLGIADATINTFVGATEALNFPFPANLLAFATTVATGLGAVKSITSVAAAGGADFVTNKPTMLLVGDNPGGRERVTVEPLSGVGKTRVFNGGVAMAGGGSMTIDGGASKNSAVRETNQALLYANAIKNMPKPVVGWAEGKRVRDRVDFKQKVTRR